ncbi:MAG: hypothetical protein HLUCCO02_06600 [Idiomarinaceae bacterium HL-53]|nr:MAG: hypothetical protein HLUCCO02_06600 [Idiomarinaceae bacterium HL-53]
MSVSKSMLMPAIRTAVKVSAVSSVEASADREHVIVDF